MIFLAVDNVLFAWWNNRFYRALFFVRVSSIHLGLVPFGSLVSRGKILIEEASDNESAGSRDRWTVKRLPRAVRWRARYERRGEDLWRSEGCYEEPRGPRHSRERPQVAEYILVHQRRPSPPPPPPPPPPPRPTSGGWKRISHRHTQTLLSFSLSLFLLVYEGGQTSIGGPSCVPCSSATAAGRIRGTDTNAS